MINIKVDLTNINKRLDKMQDYFSVDKTDNGKKFVSKITEAGVGIFQDNSLFRMETHTPPNSKEQKSGKLKSIRGYAKKFTKNLFISEQKLSQTGVVIGIGVDLSTHIPTPIEPRYEPGDGEFSNWMKSLGIYNPAPAASDNIFFIRHHGTGAQGDLIGYSHAHSYPSNLHILGVSGRLLTTKVIREALDRFASVSTLSDANDSAEETDNRIVRIKQKKAKLIKRDKITGEIINKEEDIKGIIHQETSKIDISAYYGKDPLLDTILAQIHNDSVDDFIHAKFESVKDKRGHYILMWHHGIRPYDWFHNTKWGNAKGIPFQEDLDSILRMIQNSYIALAGKI